MMILYLDCSNGVSGDMLVAALLGLAGATPDEAGPLEEVVRPALKAAGIDPRLVTLQAVESGGVEALSFRVADAPGFATFDELIMAMYASKVGQEVADDVAAVAQRMAAAESEVHGEDEAHLHELSGVDTAADLISAAALVQHLAPDHVMASPPALGWGVVHTAHGELPVPAPAVAALVRGLPVAEEDLSEEHAVGELTTPTGAALLAHFVERFGPAPAGAVAAMGTGAGQRVLLDRANVLRATLIEPAAVPEGETVMEQQEPQEDTGAHVPWEGVELEADAEPGHAESEERATEEHPETRAGVSSLQGEPGQGQVELKAEEAPAQKEPGPSGTEGHVVLETNIDDMSAELLAHAADALRKAGAVDVWLTPAIMKKGRPGSVLHALVAAADRDRLADVIFAETSTFGLRVLPVGRLYARERYDTVTIAGSQVGVRMAFVDDRLVTVSPEFEDCRAVAAAVGRPVKVVYEAVQAAARKRFSGS